MRQASSQTGVVIRRLPVLVFAVWLAGAGCLFCCASVAEAAPHADEAVTRASAPSVAAEHSCCTARAGTRRAGRQHHEDDSATLSQAPSPTGEAHACCQRGRQAADVSRKPRVSEGPAVAPSGERVTPASPASAFAPAASPRSRLPDRGGTYLRGCVFLI